MLINTFIQTAFTEQNLQLFSRIFAATVLVDEAKFLQCLIFTLHFPTVSMVFGWHGTFYQLAETNWVKVVINESVFFYG